LFCEGQTAEILTTAEDLLFPLCIAKYAVLVVRGKYNQGIPYLLMLLDVFLGRKGIPILHLVRRIFRRTWVSIFSRWIYKYVPQCRISSIGGVSNPMKKLLIYRQITNDGDYPI
jgi:hypothetical protein